jgi:putative cell wall-binding protein
VVQGRLAGSTATWQLVGNPQMIAPVLFPPLPSQLTGQIADLTGLFPRDGAGYNSDQWDGYRAARDEILRHLADNGIDNTVFLTGDIHSSWACDLPIDPAPTRREPVGRRRAGRDLDHLRQPRRDHRLPAPHHLHHRRGDDQGNNRHIKLLEFDSHGFSVVDVTPERTQMDWFYLRSASPDRPQHDPTAAIVYAQSWKVDEAANAVSPADEPVEDGVVERLAGPNRFATAAAISAATFEPGVLVAFVATGLEFPDALAGGVAAARSAGPVLLVTADAVPEETAAELERLDPGEIVVLGGERAVSAAVEAELAELTSASVRRIAGESRFATAAAVSAETFPDGAPAAYIATGGDFPDALAGVPAAVVAEGPILLVTDSAVPAETAAELRRLAPDAVVVLGGERAVSEAVRQELEAITGRTARRLAGATRFATALAVSRDAFGDGAAVVYAATGGAFPDALAGGAVAALASAPVLLVEPDDVPEGVLEEIGRLGATRVVVLGGVNAISRNVARALSDAVRR